MLTLTSIPKGPPDDPALDQERLFALGLEHVRRLARRVWTDHNTHDPGITTLELLCYALTDLGYRATFPVEDLLARPDGAGPAAPQFFTAREILPSRPLTLLDYRKLLIDLKDIRNAWIDPVTHTLYADPVAGRLHVEHPGTPGVRAVEVRGLFRVLVELMDGITPEAEDAALAAARARLDANRNLCQDFIAIERVEKQRFILCGELELDPDADAAEVHAEVLFQVEQYLSPAVHNYTLDEMLARERPGGGRMTVDEIFDGPALDYGFIDDDELAATSLRTEVRLSDVINVIMDIEGVRAVRDLIINPIDTTGPLPDRWVVPVAAGMRPTLDGDASRLVLYKRNMPILARREDVAARYAAMASAARSKLESLPAAPYDIEIPRGRHRDLDRYFSFQNHFPAIYGLGEDGPPGGADERRKALALQMKGYLLFFDQLMADYCAQLARVKDLFSTDPSLERTYFHHVVDSFKDWSRIYGAPGGTRTVLEEIEAFDDPDLQIERRNRFLDHLVARFAERFHEYAAVTAASLGATPRSFLRVKCEFLKDYPSISRDRGLGYDSGRTTPLWDTDNVSGVERRVARLVGMPPAARRDLGGPDVTPAPEPGAPDPDEGMLLIENLLLRMPGWGEPLLPICGDPACADCSGDDPYSYRVHVLLPAYAGRFTNIDFRRFVEEVIREEMPAHVVAKVCWIRREDMAAVEGAYRAWLEARAAGSPDLADRLRALVHALYEAKNVYPVERLRRCVPGDERPRFQLGRSALGSVERDGDG